MTIEKLKGKKDYSFYCNITKESTLKEIADTDCFDEWGCAYLSIGNEADEIGVEYNLCVDGNENCSAIYKVYYNEKTDCLETDYDEFIHYEIDFNNCEWGKELENAMCKALIEIFEL